MCVWLCVYVCVCECMPEEEARKEMACASSTRSHTLINIHTRTQHFFGGGIVSVPHAEFLASYHMQPFQTLDLGDTEVSEDLFDE